MEGLVTGETMQFYRCLFMLMAQAVNQELRTGMAIDLNSIDGDFGLTLGVDHFKFLTGGLSWGTMNKLKGGIVAGLRTYGMVFWC